MTINGKKITVMRATKNISRQELANKSGVSLTTISNYETGKTKNADPNILRSIATALDTTPELFEDTSKLAANVMEGRDESIHKRFDKENRYMTPFETQKFVKNMRNGDTSIAESEAKRAMNPANQRSLGNKTYAVVSAVAINIPKWQRDTDREKCTSLAESYDENKYDPIKVYILNGKMFVADGAHRLVSYLLRKEDYILVEILTCKTDEEAATTFLTQSISRRRLSQNDMWRAAIQVGLEQYKALRSICMECKIQIKADLYKISNPVGVMNTVSGSILRFAKVDPVLLKRVLQMIGKLNWNVCEASPYKTYIIQTLRGLYATYSGRENELENLLMITCKGASYYEEKICTTMTQSRLNDTIMADLEKMQETLYRTVSKN